MAGALQRTEAPRYIAAALFHIRLILVTPAPTLLITQYATSGNACASSTVTLTVVNQAPTPGDDSYTAHGTLSVAPYGVLINDSDPDGDGLSITDAGSRTLAHGSLTLYTSGSFSYIPNYGYTGPDSFTYTIQDSLGK